MSADAAYSGYTTTEKVKHKAGITDQDDIKDRFVTDAIKASERFIDKACLRTTPFDSPVASDLEMACTLLASANIVLEMQSADKDYSDFLNMGMMYLSQFTKTDVSTLINQWGFMFLSTGNTRPENPDADPFISMNHAW